MRTNISTHNNTQVNLRPVNGDNWRDIAKLKVTEAQREFVADPCYYLALCCYSFPEKFCTTSSSAKMGQNFSGDLYGGIWHPIAVYVNEQVIGFLMWGLDAADGSCWLGGLLIDQNYQRQGYGRQAIQAAITMLAKEQGYQQFALSYSPINSAKHLYQQLGFIETNEWENDEVVARLSLGGKG